MERVPTGAQRGRGGWLTLSGASKNNLKDLTVRFPLGRLVLVTGVSGSGKSTLIRECLLPALKSRFMHHAPRNTQHASRISHHLSHRLRLPPSRL